MMEPAVVVDIDYLKHQNVYQEMNLKSTVLGTLHGQTQCLSVFEKNILDELNIKQLVHVTDPAVLEDSYLALNFRKAGAVAREIERSRNRLGMLALLVAAVLATLVMYFWARKVHPLSLW